MSDLTALIERLEKATGPDEVLDEAIFEALYGNDPLAAPWRKFTASVDAALTLIEGGWLLHFWDRIDGTRDAVLWRDRRLAEGQHPTSRAIALCIAALKARLPA